MRTMNVLVGAGALLAAGAIGAAVLLRDEPTPDATPGTTATGIDVMPDAMLPGVASGGASQAAWAAAVVEQLDVDGDRAIGASDAAGAVGAWGPAGPRHVIGELVVRYDASGDGTIDPAESRRIGADVATDGWLSADAADQLRRALGA
jgi:hypothetical protein